MKMWKSEIASKKFDLPHGIVAGTNSLTTILPEKITLHTAQASYYITACVQ